MTGRFVALVAAAAVAFLPGSADARFGKRSSAKQSESKSDGEKEHAASAVGDGPTEETAPYRYRSHGYRRRHWHGSPIFHGWFFWGPRYPAYEAAPTPPPMVEATPEPQTSTPQLVIGGEGFVFSRGASAGVGLQLEGERHGLNLGFSGLVVGADDGSDGLDVLRFASAHYTYALLAEPQGRLRLELGGDAVFAPDVTVLGPTVGVSGIVWLLGPLACEASAMWTVFPHRQLDARAGLGLGLGPLGLRAGWRLLALEEDVVDGQLHRDVFAGPYVGVALVF